ncbi:expressed unknown protein [Seminavis robusta]|uniref:Uncharacterized protein n=1 Tax=Seminavis robusta TaxID=568900 RepID=A0A9N8DCU5_9STRA|nr:expressed unknown protein [Seminavis robusta]|eukprot:Sro81_g043460.1 n/a (255) ;mRNA; f:48033-48797
MTRLLFIRRTTTALRPPFLLLLLVSLLIILPTTTSAYRMGDAIDAEISIPKKQASGATTSATNKNEEIALKRSQMPLFGMSTSSKVQLGDAPKFSLVLEEGFRSLPVVWLKKGSSATSSEIMVLESLEVQLVFSRSSGEIHALHHTPKYSKADTADSNRDNQEITLRYNWIEEESVDLNGGAFVMFLAVFIVSLFFLIDLCGLCADNDDIYDTIGNQDPYYSNPNINTTTTYDHNNPIDPMAVMSGGRPAPKYE